MKKLVNYVAIAATAALIPFTASALEPMSNAAKKELTGQAGVTIALDDVSIETWTGETKYIDSESLDGTAGGAIVVGPSQVRTRFRALMGGTYNTAINDDLQADYGFQLTGLTDGTFQQAQPLSINIGNCSIMTAGIENNIQFLKDTMVPNSNPYMPLVSLYDKAYAGKLIVDMGYLTKEAYLAELMTDTEYNKGASYAVASGLYKRFDSEIQGIVQQKDHQTGELLFEQEVDANGDPVVDANGDPVMVPVMGPGGTGVFTATDMIGVQIEVPTLVIENSGKTTTVGVAQLGEYDPADPTTLTAVNHGQNFITIESGPSVLAIYSGRVEIAAH